MRLLTLAAPSLGALLLAMPSLGAQQAPPQRPPVRGTPAKGAPAKGKPVAAQPVAEPPTIPTTGYLQGVAFDSVHGEALIGAMLQVEGTSRFAIADSLGRFLVDSIPPGMHRVLIDHPVLDTLGLGFVTSPLSFAANEVTHTVIALPSGDNLVAKFCTPARRSLGPGALVGRVREPDSDVAAEGARVSFVWYDPDPPGLPMGLHPTKRQPRVREATVAADGTYRLCGLPEKFEGKLQAQRKDGGATAEVTVTQDGGLLALRSMSVAPLPAVATATTPGTPAAPARRGTARVFGKVLNSAGAPVPNARVGLVGTTATAVTRANGDFLLDSLPAGTQAIAVRQLGYQPTEQTVELSSRAPARVTVKLGKFVPVLSAVEVVSKRDEGLQSVGFLDRKRNSTGGHFMEGDEIDRRHALQFTDLMRTMPGLRVQSAGGTNQTMLTSSRSTTGSGCVTIFIDGAKMEQLEPGDLDSFARPDETAAIEVYSSGGSMPPQFSTPGQDCSAVVIWTKNRVLRRN
jgi:hypothetical protein